MKTKGGHFRSTIMKNREGHTGEDTEWKHLEGGIQERGVVQVCCN